MGRSSSSVARPGCSQSTGGRGLVSRFRRGLGCFLGKVRYLSEEVEALVDLLQRHDVRRQPVEAVESAESISLHDVVGNCDVFALEVRGDSMRDEHIISGDYVLVERTRTARQGEIVVALVHGAETTLKRFYNEGAQIRLQPANIEMEPIYVKAADVMIQGRVLGVLRKYR